MAEMNDFLTRLRTELLAIDPAPDAVYIVPQGQEEYRGPASKAFWVNVSPSGEEEAPESGAYYVSSYTATITVWIDSKAKDDTIVSTLSGKVTDVRDKLRYNSLSRWLRRDLAADRFGGGEYISGGESDTVYGYQLEVTGEKQDN